MKKEALIEQEYGCLDYGIIEKQTAELKSNKKKEEDNSIEEESIQVENEVKNMKLDEELTSNERESNKKMEEDEKVNETKEQIEKNTVKETVHMEEPLMRYKNRNRVDSIYTMWDISAEVRAAQVRKCLQFYGRIRFIGWKNCGTSKAAIFSVEFKNEKRKAMLDQAWSVHFEEGKTCRVTPGTFAREVLEKRALYKAIVKNIPMTAIEVLLLRQLKAVKAKAVYILVNRNRN
jgi:hypothetical protein